MDFFDILAGTLGSTGAWMGFWLVSILVSSSVSSLSRFAAEGNGYTKDMMRKLENSEVLSLQHLILFGKHYRDRLEVVQAIEKFVEVSSKHK